MDHRLLEIIELGNRIYSLRIQPRPDKPFPYLPGNEARVYTKRGRLIFEGVLLSNPFSDEQLMITAFSNKKVRATPGSYVDVEPVRSNFVLRPVSDYNRNFLFFAEAAGILPVSAMINAVLHVEQRSRQKLVWIDPDRYAFLDNQLDLWESMVHGRLEIIRPEHRNDLKIWLNSFLTVPGETPGRIYICGSETFVTFLISRLDQAGIGTGRVIYRII